MSRRRLARPHNPTPPAKPVAWVRPAAVDWSVQWEREREEADTALRRRLHDDAETVLDAEARHASQNAQGSPPAIAGSGPRPAEG